jgi:hypothetical protein
MWDWFNTYTYDLLTPLGMSHLKNHNSFYSRMSLITLGKNNFRHQLVLTHEKYYQHFHFQLHHLLNVVCVCVCVRMHACTHAHGDTVLPPLSAHEYLWTELLFYHYKLWWTNTHDGCIRIWLHINPSVIQLTET